MAAVLGVEQFGQAISAYGEVGGDSCGGGFGVIANSDFEVLKAGGIGGLDIDGRDFRGGRGFGFE
jgi:hypothetical protein